MKSVLAQLLGVLAGVACVASNPRDAEAIAAARTTELGPPSEARIAAREPASPDARAHAEDPHATTRGPAARPEADAAKPSRPIPQWIVRPDVSPGLRAFADARPTRGSLFVGPMNGNGGREVVVYVPPDSDPSQPFEIIHHFHGTYSEHIQAPGPGVPKKQWVGWNRLQQTMDAADELQATRPYNVVLVYPLSAGKRLEPEHEGWSNVAYDRMWMRPVGASAGERFDRFHEDVIALLRDELHIPTNRIGERVFVEGHSAGGIALLNVAASGSRHATHYLFQDASFQGWADGCYAALRTAAPSPRPGRVIIVITHDGMADAVGAWRPWCRELEANAEAFGHHRSWCETNPGRTPRASPHRCDVLAQAAEQWPASRDWCEGMKTDLAGWPGVAVHRTKVPHGEHPRHFTGGLHLPPELQ